MSQCSGRIYYPTWINNILSEPVPAPELPRAGSRGGGCQVFCRREYEQVVLPGQFPGRRFIPIHLQSPLGPDDEGDSIHIIFRYRNPGRAAVKNKQMEKYGAHRTKGIKADKTHLDSIMEDVTSHKQKNKCLILSKKLNSTGSLGNEIKDERGG